MNVLREETYTELRHRLRTPLTHIVGYSALLMEGDEADQEMKASLSTVNEQAESILERVGFWLGADSDVREDRMAGLRREITQPLTVIIRTVGALAQRANGAALLDVLRIGRACTELLTFVYRQGGPGGGKTPLSLARPVARESATGTEVRVLVIDDNPVSLDMLARQLQGYGYSAACVESGPAGLHALDDDRYDLVLLDVMMPGLGGVDVLKQIRAKPNLADIPVIMISALDEVESAAQCIELGAEDYLLKPPDPVLLRARLHSALERKRLEAERWQRTRDLEKATEALKRANEDLESFASIASHDLQEPLRTVSNTLQLFAANAANLPEEQRQLVELAVDGAKRMSRLISGLLAYSVSDGASENLTNVDCEAALLEAITNVREAIKDAGAQITHTELPVVKAHPGGMVRLFQNLLANAIKYRSDKRPVIRITAERDGAEWVISVEDNGIGIDKRFQRHIFQPFRRLHGQERPGTGLGLAICERIVRKSGGRIWVDSEPDEGSVFHFTALPAEPSPAAEYQPAVPVR